jgi:YD repeat-containing protein
MKTTRLLFVLLQSVALFGQYQYFFSDPFAATFGGLPGSNWLNPGFPYGILPGGGLTGGTYYGSGASAPLIYNGQLPANDRYEIKSTFPSINTYPTSYIQYVAATNSGHNGDGDSAWSFYAVEFRPTSFSPCVGNISVYRQDVVGDNTNGWYPQRSYITSGGGACPDNTTMRTLFSGAVGSAPSITVLLNDQLAILPTPDPYPNPLSGKPGVAIDLTWTGTGTSGLISRVDIGPWDNVPPNAVNASTIRSTPYNTRVDIQWGATTDDPVGTGIYSYTLLRNGTPIASGQNLTSFSDQAVQQATTYTYAIQATDFHQNVSPQTTFTVTTLDTHVNITIATPPSRIGVRPTGAYWGAGGEQIDVASGNLNFTLPLLKAQSRGGASFGFSLNYNSQIWRQNNDSSGPFEWNLGADVGYGFGWKLMAGSIEPYWSDQYTIDHYIFTDSTGAEYKLGLNTNGIWTSNEGIYLSYDPNMYKLSFPDGTFWMMTCESSANEPDVGTRYPTVMQDTNGNQVFIHYQIGQGYNVPDTSARISVIEDVRATPTNYNNGSGPHQTYTFTYNSDPIPHLIGIANWIQTGEAFTFTYAVNQPLSSPFSSTAYANTTLLQSVLSTSTNIKHSFEFAGGFGELSRVILPYGGYIRWAYQPFTFANGTITIREVQNRYLSKDGSTETTYTLSRDAIDYSRNWHGAGYITDPTGAVKSYIFSFDPSQWWNGLMTSFYQAGSAGQAPLRQLSFTWVQDPVSNPYIGSSSTTLDPNTSYQQITTTIQTLDAHGNVTQSQIYDFGNPSTPARIYANTYLTDTNNLNYTSRNIWNRLVSRVVRTGNGSQGPVPLETNSYDAANVQALPTGSAPLREHDDTNYGVSFQYRGNVTSHVDPSGGFTAYRYITGDVSSVTGTGGDSTITPTAVTNYAAPGAITANNFTTTLAYNGFLETTSATGPNNEVTSMGYDAGGQLGGFTTPYGASTGVSRSYNPPMTTVSTGTHYVESDLDGLGRPIRVKTGDSTGVKSWADTEYDSCACSPLGKIKRTSQPYAPNGSPAAWTTYTYDGLGRTLSVVSPDGQSSTTYLYQGNTTTITDPAGNWKKYVTDAMGHLIQVIEPNPGNN